MSHGYSILELTRIYEKQSKKFGKMTKDIMTNNTEYYGVMSVAKNFDLLIALIPNDRQYAVNVAIFRGWPDSQIASTNSMSLYFSEAIEMFPEIKTVKFTKGKWPEPYNKE